MTAAILAAMVAMCGPERAARLAGLAPAIVEEAAAHGLDPILAVAVMRHESTCRPWARGSAGEVGLMQIHPRGMAQYLCRDLRVARDVDNVRCGIRILARAQRVCGGGDPMRWLGVYSGVRKCRETRYARRVMGRARRPLNQHIVGS